MSTGKLSRRHFVQLFATTAAGAALAACAPKAKPTEQPAAPTEPTPVVVAPTPVPAIGSGTKVTIFVGFGTGTDPAQIEGHTQLAKEFNETHADQVEFLTVPWAERNTKFSTMIAGDMAPDLCMPIGVGGVAAFFDEWLDITPFIDRDGYDMSDFTGLTVKYHTYPGKILGLPIGVYPEVTFYNEDLFDGAKVPYPPHKYGEASWTYDTLVETAKKLTIDEGGKNALDAGFDWTKSVEWGWDTWEGIKDMVFKWGGSPLGMSDDYKTAAVNTKGWIDCVQWMADLVWKHHVKASSEQAAAFSQAGDPMSSGKVGMWECQSWMSYAFKGWTDVFNWDLAAIPGGPVGVVCDEDADTFVMPKHSKHQDAAWGAAKWFASPEIIPRLGAIWGSIPARKSNLAAWKTDMEKKWPGKDWQVMLDSLDHMGLPNTEAWVPDSEKVVDVTNRAWDLINTGKETDVKKVLDAANVEIQGLLDEYWKTH